MIKTLGLTHIALPVKDVKRSAVFYQKVFGVKEMYGSPGSIQVQTPGTRDVIVFEKQKKASKTKPNFHFGFRLAKPSAIESIVETVKAAGGKISEKGEFVPGEAYVSFYDPMATRLKYGLKRSHQY